MEKISAKDIERIIDAYGNILFRLCLIMLGNASDAEDAVQETLMKYLQKAPEFKDREHEKAWLLKVASNKCRDMLRFRVRHLAVDIESYRIEDTSGNVIVDNNPTDMVKMNGEQLELSIPLEGISNGNYKLIIDAFIGGKKADQPLRINGLWECEFVK